MKRELKVICHNHYQALQFIDRKAHPDEKGTERTYAPLDVEDDDEDRKAHPDEKGTESTKMQTVMSISM